MIKNETKSNPSFLQHEKEKLTILNLQRYELIELIEKYYINIRDDGDRCSSSVGRVTEKDLDVTDYFENGQSVYLGKGCWGHET